MITIYTVPTTDELKKKKKKIFKVVKELTDGAVSP